LPQRQDRRMATELRFGQKEIVTQWLPSAPEEFTGHAHLITSKPAIRFAEYCTIGVGVDWPTTSWTWSGLIMDMQRAKVRNPDENYSCSIGALHIGAKRSRHGTGLPRDRKHERATRLLRCGASSEDGKARSR
jgi:hypothetical protein